MSQGWPGDAPSDERVDWGPGRPLGVSWAGVLLFFLGLCQLVLLTWALIRDSAALLDTAALAAAVVFSMAFAVLELVAAVGVIRLGRFARRFAIVLVAVGLVLQALNMIGSEGEAPLIILNLGFTLVYLIVLVLLVRNGPAFA